jgi:hypothetical protein
MQGTRQFLELVRDQQLVSGHLSGVFHIAIGRRISTPAGDLLAAGVTWRELAALLKELKFDRELVRELGADPDQLSPKDREKFWYYAVAMAKVDGPEASGQADELAARLAPLGLVVGPHPGGLTAPPTGSEPADPSAPLSQKGRRKKK